MYIIYLNLTTSLPEPWHVTLAVPLRTKPIGHENLTDCPKFLPSAHWVRNGSVISIGSQCTPRKIK